MDSKTVIRWILIAAAVLLFWKCGLPLITGKGNDTPQATQLPAEKYVDAPDFKKDTVDGADEPPPAGEACFIRGADFDAELSSRGAGLKHFKMRNPKYGKLNPNDPKEVDASDMVAIEDRAANIERWRNLRTLFRGDPTNQGEGATGDKAQLEWDRFNWTLAPQTDPGVCEFSYEDKNVRITKRVAANERPYELAVDTTITNLAGTKRTHEFVLQQFAYHTNEDMKGSLGRTSPFLTDLQCASGTDVDRKSKDDFKTGWAPPRADVDRFAAIANYYFAQALVPVANEPGGLKPACRMLAQSWVGANQRPDDDAAGYLFHSELSYPPTDLEPQQSASYHNIAYFGPKERDILAHAAGGTPKLGDLINLGFFSVVAKVLVGILTWIHAHLTFGNWGVAIIVMTIGLRLCLFPLTWKSIKTTVGMRRLKPEIDELTKKFKGDAQAKNLAMMELYRKNKVSPFGGCLPQLVQMPVWFAMYTTLQTAVEMYHTPFLWFKDLSAPDKLFGVVGLLPFLLGGFMILQQRIVPQQGMDPMQQKMMNWLLPIIFTVMMLFLPAALGVYMLTNSILGIVQQLAVEKFAPRKPAADAGKGGSGKGQDIVVKQMSGESGSAKGAPALVGKGKARV